MCPPERRVRHFRTLNLTMGVTFQELKVRRPKGDFRSSRRAMEKKIAPMFAADALMGDSEVQRGRFASGFPHRAEDFDSSHHLSCISTTCGAESADTAQPRIRTAKKGGAWGCRTGLQGFQPRAVRVRVTEPPQKMRYIGDSRILDAH